MENPLLRVLFLTLYPETMPSSRLRVYQYLPYLRQRGIDATVLPAVPEPWFSRFYFSSSRGSHFIQYGIEIFNTFARLSATGRYDVIFVQKGILGTNLRGFDRLLGKARGRLIFDLDDSVYGRNVVEFNRSFFRLFQDRHQTEKISSRCQAVVAGNSYLKNLALQYNPNVFLIPTPVDTDRFRPSQENSKGAREEIVIGWIGIEGALAYLRILEGVLRGLSRRYPIRLKVIARFDQKPFALEGVRTTAVRWSYQTEVEELEELDIGLMPLPDDEWVRGKCGLKLLQYMSMAIPSVASRLGANSEIVEEGRDGFLASGLEEWTEKLSSLIEDAPLRKKMGEEARAKVLEKYSLQRMAPRLARVLKDEEGPQ